MYKPSTYLLIAYFPTYLPIGAYNPKHHPVKAIRSLTRSVQVKTNPVKKNTKILQHIITL